MVGDCLKHATLRVMEWSRRLHGAPLLFSAVVLLWIGLLIIDLPAVHAMTKHWTKEWEESHESSSEVWEAAHFQWSKSYPTVLFIDFDQASLDHLTNSSPFASSITVKPDIAALLDWLRSDKQVRPALVFVDLSPLGEPNPADGKLLGAIHDWATDTDSAPLALFAGRACHSNNPYEPVTPLGPSPYSDVVLPDRNGSYAASVGHGNVIWTCPIYDQLIERAFWYCAEANDTGNTVALLSPGWFAHLVREGGRDFLRAAGVDLKAANAACLGDRRDLEMGPKRTMVARSNRVKLTFNPGEVNNGQLDGNPVVLTLPAVEILNDLASKQKLAKIYNDKIVVIGSTASIRGQNDQISTRFGDVPGSIIIAEELRAGWALGYPNSENWWASQVVATLIVAGSFLLFGYTKTIRARWGRGKTFASRIVEIIANLHVTYAVVIPALSWITLKIGQIFVDLDWYKIAFAFVLTEVIVIPISIAQEHHEEGSDAHTSDLAVPISADIGAGPS